MRMHIPVAVRWADLDGYGHVNNADVLRLLEEARIATFWAAEDGHESVPTAILDGKPDAATQTLIARHEIEYLRPIPYRRRPLDVQVWIARLGGADLTLAYEIHGDDVVYARAASRIVLVDAATGRPRRITPIEREAWSPYVGEAVPFRR